MWQESSEGVQNEPSQNVWLIDGWIILSRGNQDSQAQEKLYFSLKYLKEFREGTWPNKGLLLETIFLNYFLKLW